MVYTITNLFIIIFSFHIWMVLFLISILIIHPIVIFGHILIQIFLQFIAGLDRVVFLLGFSHSRIRIFGQCWGYG